jgi:glucosamine--fructose-6-phosphate aminotransferase (isomerizing)
MEIGQATREEIFSQHKAWSAALDEIEANREALSNYKFQEHDQIIFTGCGSTYYLSLSAAAIFQKMTGVSCKAVPGGELMMNPHLIYSGKRDLLVAVSRSGSTTETVKAAEQFKDNTGGAVISITNYEDQPIGEVSDLSICITAGQEESVAQTRSFSSMHVAATAMAMMVSGNQYFYDSMQTLPAICEKLLYNYRDFARSLGENLNYDRFYFLGSGCRFGVGCEANLKMKEMTQTHTEPYYFLEFRHGPKSMVNENAVVIGLLSEEWQDFESQVLDEMAEIGGHIVSLAESDAVISFNSGVPDEVRTILYLPVLQMMAFYRSLKKGLNPDKPKNLSTVVVL